LPYSHCYHLVFIQFKRHTTFLTVQTSVGLAFTFSLPTFQWLATNKLRCFGLVCECGLGKSVWIERIRWLSGAVMPGFRFQVMHVFVCRMSDFRQTKCQLHSPHSIHAEGLHESEGALGPSKAFASDAALKNYSYFRCCIFSTTNQHNNQPTGLTIIATL